MLARPCPDPESHRRPMGPCQGQPIARSTGTWHGSIVPGDGVSARKWHPEWDLDGCRFGGQFGLCDIGGDAGRAWPFGGGFLANNNSIV
jgi:hypothetical protein